MDSLCEDILTMHSDSVHFSEYQPPSLQSAGDPMQSKAMTHHKTNSEPISTSSIIEARQTEIQECNIRTSNTQSAKPGLHNKFDLLLQSFSGCKRRLPRVKIDADV